MLRTLLLTFMITFSSLSFAQTEMKAIVGINSAVKSVSLGSTYDWQFIISPWNQDLPDKEQFLGSEFAPFVYVTDVYSIKLSENNSDALVVSVKAILAKDYRQPSLNFLNLDKKKISLRYDLPQEIQTIEVDGGFTLMNRDNPFQGRYVKWLILSIVLLAVVLFLAYRLRKKKNKEKSSFLYRARDYSEKEKLEKFYNERREFLHLDGASDLIKELEKLQYRPDWKDSDKGELVKRLEQVFEVKE